CRRRESQPVVGYPALPVRSPRAWKVDDVVAHGQLSRGGPAAGELNVVSLRLALRTGSEREKIGRCRLGTTIIFACCSSSTTRRWSRSYTASSLTTAMTSWA